jgi:hypothetical protein
MMMDYCFDMDYTVPIVDFPGCQVGGIGDYSNLMD